MKKTFMGVMALVCAVLTLSCADKAQGSGSELAQLLTTEKCESTAAVVDQATLDKIFAALNVSKTDGVEQTIVDEDFVKMDTLSYALGTNVGLGLKQQFGEIATNFSVPEVRRGLVDASAGRAALSHEAVIDELRVFFSQTLNERYQAYNNALAADSTAVFNPFVDDAERNKVSYAIGHDVSSNMRNNNIPVKPYWLAKGFQDGWDNSSELSTESMMGYLHNYFNVVLPSEAAKRSAAWLEKKKAEPGVQTTASGLAYRIIEQGDMSKAAKNDDDKVKVHYVGALQNGKVFDASRFEDRSKEQQDMIRLQQPSLFDENGNFTKNEPIEFALNQVIKGWTDGMKLVGPGGKIVLYIPAELAYGRYGAGQMIGPNEALMFAVELLDVTPAVVEPAPVVEATEETPATVEDRHNKYR